MDPKTGYTGHMDPGRSDRQASLRAQLQACTNSVDLLARELDILRNRIHELQCLLDIEQSGADTLATLAADRGTDLSVSSPAERPETSRGLTQRHDTSATDNIGTFRRYEPGPHKTNEAFRNEPFRTEIDSVKGARRAPIDRQFLHVEDWLSRFSPEELPVLERTRGEIEHLRERQDSVDPQELALIIESDPMMTLKLFARVAQIPGRTHRIGPDSVKGALLMLGVVPFFSIFDGLSSVESRLRSRPEALEGLYAVLDRSYRAARFALAFAVHRMDPDAALLYCAALLHDVAELLLWCSEPDLARDIRSRLRARPGLRSAQAQTLVLNVKLIEIQHALMYRWRMPDRLIAVLDGQKTENQLQVRTVELAVRVARHTANSWKDAAIPDDLLEIGRLLQLSTENVRKLILDIDRD
jgi:HD-like signal output (HDOD) protein